MIPDPYQHATLALGCVRPRIVVATAVDVLADMDDGQSAHLAERLRSNRAVLVAGTALDSAESAGSANPGVTALRRALDPHVAKMADRRKQISRALEIVAEAAGDTYSVWGIKGLTAREMYPQPDVRDLRDVDLAMRSPEESFRMAKLLRRKGFQTDRWELPWLKLDGAGRTYGQYKLIGPDGVASVDIHFGPWYSTGHCGVLPLGVPADAAPGLHTLDPVANLRLMLGNSGGDCNVTLKDVNDLSLAAEWLTDAQVDDFLADARSVLLADHLARIAAAALNLTDPAGSGHAVLTRLAGRYAGTAMSTRPRPAKRQVVMITARRAFGQAAQHGAALPARLGAAAGAVAYYSAPLTLRTHPLPAARIVPAPWRCVRLVPARLAEQVAVEGAQALRHWAGDAEDDHANGTGTGTGPATGTSAADVDGMAKGRGLVSPDGTAFVPTVWYALSRPLIRRMARKVASR